MKKIILLFFAFFLSFSAYSQFPTPGIEGFESTTGPDALPSTTWTLGTGAPGNQWAVFDNGVGTGRWGINTTPALVYQGFNSGYINRVQTGTTTTPLTSENYLATPRVTVPANGQIRFYTRSFTAGNTGTFYDVKVALGTANQILPASYTTTIATYTEDQLTLDPQGVQNSFDTYTLKIINFPAAMVGTQVYVAFVRRNTQETPSIDGDRWLIDNVQLNERCLNPTTLAASVLSGSANLTWANPSGATSWEIEVLPAATATTGIGFLYTGTLPYLATTTSYGTAPNTLPLIQTPLTPLTAYKYYVRAVCPGNIPSDWVGPFSFTTSAAPPVCGGNFLDSGGTTANYAVNENLTTTICPIIPGEKVTVNFTLFNTEATFDGLYVYNGNTVTPTALLPSANPAGSVPGGLAGSYWGNLLGTNLPGPFTSTTADGCLTFVFRSDPQVVNPGWISSVTCAVPPPCQQPTNLTATLVTTTTAQLGWISPGTATSWQVIALPAGSPPPDALTTGWTLAPTNPLVLTGLIPGKAYEYYVRGDCGTVNGVSLWSGPRAFTTIATCPPPTGLTVSLLTTTTAQLNWTTVVPSVSWQVIALPCGSPAPTDSTTGWVAAATHPFVITGLTPATCYNFYVRGVCTLTDISSWSPLVTGTTQLLPPVCGGNFVDTGGTTGNYPNNSNSTVTICPVISTDQVTVTFTSFSTEANFDGLYVYNGSVVTPTALIPSGNLGGGVPGGLAGSYWGNTIPGPFTSTAPDGCLTFVFRSDGSGTNPGWISSITCLPPPACQKPIALTTTALTFNSVSFGWTNAGLATSWQVLWQPCTAPPPTATSTGWTATTTNPFVITGLSSATCYNLYVRGDCSSTSNGVSLWAGPVSVTTQVAPPLCGGNFVDVGGPTGNYPNNSNSTVTICPTLPGEIVTVTFTSFNTEVNFDGLYVYDGNTVTPGALIPSANPAGAVPGGLAGSYWGTAIPGPFTSTTADGCLTFVFRSDGSVVNPGWISNITCSPAPTCAKPTALTATAVTQTSATISWTQPLNPNGSLAAAWEILILPAGSPIPTTPGIPATSPYLATGLSPGTAYVFYVRAICSTTDSSNWSALPFATIPVNDECSNATFAIVNQNLNCVQTTPGTLAGATGSLPATTCPGVANDDVWFTFTATGATHVISFNNVVPLPAPAFNYAIYQGTCGTLTQVGTCNSGAGLTPGTTYFIRVYSTSAVPQFTTFNLCIGTLPCTEAPAFCTGQTVTYANATSVPSLGAIGCLGSSPNPAFFFLQVNQAGPLSYLISQVTTAGAPIDVDYVAWGPFTDLNTACSGVPANPLPGITNPVPTPTSGCPGTLHACSFSAAPTEIMCIPNAQLCQVYVIMITNYSQQAGTVTFTQTNTGGGTTQCFPINTFNYPQNYYCQNGANPTPVLSPGATSGTYSSTPGLVINPVTGTINLAASTPGVYIITSTTLTSTGGACSGLIPSIVTTRTLIITAPANATISYSAPSYCKAITAFQNATQTGTTGGTYSASPAGLLINANTGAILPIASLPGVYTVTYTVAATGGCPVFTTTTQVEIINYVIPTFTQVAPICPGDNLSPLPTTSQNGILGVWSPAVMNNMATTAYTFTPSGAVCAATVTMTIVVGSTIPTFEQIAPICPGDNLVLPTTSENAITGTWLPAVNNTATTTYTFTPNSGACATSVTMTVVVKPAPVVTVNSSSICLGSSATVTATPAIAGNYNYVWTVPAGVPDPGNVASFNTNVGGNYSVVISLVNTNTLCNLSFETPTATGAFPNLINQNLVPCWKTTAPDGIIEVWPTGFEVAPYNGNQLIEMNGNSVADIYQDFIVNPGTTLQITFAHRGRQGSDTVRVEIGPVGGPFVTLGNFTDGNTSWAIHAVTHTIPVTDGVNYRLRFVSVSSAGGSPSVGNLLDAVSVNVLTGCPSLQVTGTVTITPFTTPTFTQIPNICQGFTAPLLPTSSTNTTAITGTWSPSAIDTSVVGSVTYTFTPDPNQCAQATTMDVIIVAPSIVPIFNAIAPICQNTTPPALPATSTNGGITGTWSPSSIDTSVVGTSTYTFTPDVGQCAVNGQISVTIIAPTLATFTQIAAICQGGNAPVLPTSSTNATAITGTWNPPTISTANAGTTTYTFTPTVGLCATGTTMQVTIHPRPVVSSVNNVDACDSYTLPSLSVGNYFSQPNGVSPITNLTLTSSQLVYVYAQSNTTPICTDQKSFQVNIAPTPQFTIEGSCVGLVYVLEVINASFNLDSANYAWSGPGEIINNGEPAVQISVPGTYTCIVSIPNGSESSCSTTHTFDANDIGCQIPKGISPNGDTLNDTFDLSGFSVSKLSIFNRYGTSVYTKTNYTNEWGGQSNSGNELADGTYYYVIELNNGGETRTGWVYINREIK